MLRKPGSPIDQTKHSQLQFQMTARRAQNITEIGQDVIERYALSDNIYCRINNLVSVYDPTEARRKRALMIDPTELEELLKKINTGPDPHMTLKVWTMVLCYLDYSTAEVRLDRTALAKAVGIDPKWVSICITHLRDYGAMAVKRTGGKAVYLVNPVIAGHPAMADCMRQVLDLIEAERLAPTLDLPAPADRGQIARPVRTACALVLHAEHTAA